MSVNTQVADAAPAAAPAAEPAAAGVYVAPPVEAAPDVSEVDMTKALDELFQMNDAPVEAQEAEAEPDATAPDAQADAAPVQDVAPQADTNPHLVEIERLKSERAEMMGVFRELVSRMNQPQQGQQQPTPDERARFEAALRAQNLNIEKPEVVDTTNKTLNAWFQANTGKSAGEFFGEYSEMKRALANMAQSSAADADRSRTMQELAQIKATEGFDALGADREHMAAAFQKYIPKGADSTYAAPANIPPHILAKLAKLEKLEAEQRKAADSTQRAQAVKQGAKPAATPAPANAAASKGMTAGVQFTDEQLAKLDMGELLRRMNLFGS